MGDLKTILNQVLGECGFAKQANFINSQNSDVSQLVALAIRSARVLSKNKWQVLRKTTNILLTTANEYDLEADFRQLIPNTPWTKGRADKPDFPTSDEAWAYVEARNIQNSLRYSMRFEAGKIAVLNPVVGETITYEYVTNNPITDITGATSKPRFTVDSDIWIIEDDLIEMDLVWRFKRLKGFKSWPTDKADFENYERSLRGTDKGAQSVSTVYGHEDLIRPIAPTADLWQQ